MSLRTTVLNFRRGPYYRTVIQTEPNKVIHRTKDVSAREIIRSTSIDIWR